MNGSNQTFAGMTRYRWRGKILLRLSSDGTTRTTVLSRAASPSSMPSPCWSLASLSTRWGRGAAIYGPSGCGRPGHASMPSVGLPPTDCWAVSG